MRKMRPRQKGWTKVAQEGTYPGLKFHWPSMQPPSRVSQGPPNPSGALLLKCLPFVPPPGSAPWGCPTWLGQLARKLILLASALPSCSSVERNEVCGGGHLRGFLEEDGGGRLRASGWPPPSLLGVLRQGLPT